MKPWQHKAVVIYGENGCGKTSHGRALAAHFGKTEVVELDGGAEEPKLKMHQLGLSNTMDRPDTVIHIHFDTAMHYLNSAKKDSKTC